MRTWIRSLFTRSSPRVTRPSPATRLGVESLEGRAMPASLSYQAGGHLLSNVEVTAVFDGNVPQAGQLTNFLNQVVDSPYLDQLGEYSAGGQTIGRGSFSGTDITSIVTRPETFAGKSYTTTDNNDITTMLNAEIAAGRVAAPDSNRLYMVYVQPNTVVNRNNGQNSVQNFTGYHQSATDSSGRTYYYAVIVDPSGYPGSIPAGVPGGLTALQYDTITSSHEMAEAITDPVLVKSWGDPSGNEVGDLTQINVPPGGAIATEDGFTVQKEWSNALNTSTAAPADAVRYVTGSGGAFVLTAGGTVEKLDTSTGNWNAVTGGITNASQLVSVGGTVYIVAANQGGTAQVWKYNGFGSSWQQITGSPYVGKLVTAGGQLFLHANNGGNWEIFQYTGSGYNWNQITGSQTNVTRLAADGTGLYLIANNWNGAYQAFRYDVPTAGWAQLTNSSTVTELVAGGGHVYIIASNGGPNHNQVYQYNGYGMNWSQLTNSPSVTQMAMAGEQVYILANNGGPNQVWRYNGSGMNWTPITNMYSSQTVESIAAAGDGLYVQFYTATGAFADSQVRKFGGADWRDWANVSGTNTVGGSLSTYGDQLEVETLDQDGHYRFRQYTDTPLTWAIPIAR